MLICEPIEALGDRSPGEFCRNSRFRPRFGPRILNLSIVDISHIDWVSLGEPPETCGFQRGVCRPVAHRPTGCDYVTLPSLLNHEVSDALAGPAEDPPSIGTQHDTTAPDPSLRQFARDPAQIAKAGPSPRRPMVVAAIRGVAGSGHRILNGWNQNRPFIHLNRNRLVVNRTGKQVVN